MKITILVDNENSWYTPYAKKLESRLRSEGHEAVLVHSQNEAEGGDISFLLSCTRLVKESFLNRYSHNIVVHASDLPEGKGFAPLKWQILEGRDRITLTMFEAVKAVDAGPYYMKRHFEVTGTELFPELRATMAALIEDMCSEYAGAPDSFEATEQTGRETFYDRPSEEDDRIDIERSILSQINLLRAADNDNYPLWFEYRGRKYSLKIYPREDKT